MNLLIKPDPNEIVVITRLGELHRIVTHDDRAFALPLVDYEHTYRTDKQAVETGPQETILENNETVRFTVEVVYRIVDVEKTFMEVQDLEKAVLRLTETTARAVIGDYSSPSTVQWNSLGTEIYKELASPLKKWGVTVDDVSVRRG